MGKLHQLSPELWPLIDVILFSYIELIFRGGVSCLPAALLFTYAKKTWFKLDAVAFKPHYEETCFLRMQKRRRSAVL